MATEENDTWGRGLTFPHTSVHRSLSITPIAAVPFVRTSKAYEKIERRSPILRGGNLQLRPQAVLSTPFPTSAAHEHPPFACSQPSHELMGGGGPPGAREVQVRSQPHEAWGLDTFMVFTMATRRSNVAARGTSCCISQYVGWPLQKPVNGYGRK